MFNPGSLPRFHPRPAWLWRGGSGHGQGAPLAIGLAVALAIAMTIAPPGPVAAADSSQPDGPSIQYQEAMAHASKTYSFRPGGVATIPFRPRSGDSTQVGGVRPIPLPAGQGSTVVAPDLIEPSVVAPNATGSILRREVFGFLPYWETGSSLDYDTLSTVAYFGVALNNDGTLYKTGNGWNGWVSTTMTTVINNAHAHGTRVALTVESFAWDSAGAAAQRALLSSPTASLTAAQQIAAEIGRRGADGVNLDFEPIASGQSANYISFVRTLRAELDKVHLGYELTFCATGSPSTYDLPNLLAAGAADAVFIMGYDLRGGTPSTAGSIDPLTSIYNRYTLTSIVGTFMSKVPASKIILGLPWYGHAWSTGPANPIVNAPPADIPTYGAPATGVTYASAKALADRDPATTPCTAGWPTPCVTGWQYDAGEQSAWTAYYGDYGGTQTTWRELYFDDSRALGAKIDAIDGWNLRGLGIWALGYDNNNGDGDLTNAIAAKLAEMPATYHPLTPARILDTRDGTGGLSGPFSSHVARTFQVTGSGGVPSTATAVTGNLTVTGQTSLGYLYMGPSAMAYPTCSTLNFPKNDDRANAVTVALGPSGTLSVTYVAPTLGPTAQVIFDVTGYFVPDTSGATYAALAPARILDTRTGTGLSGPSTSNVARTFQVTGVGGVPSGAIAVTGNLTVTQQSSQGYLYIGPVATNNPTSSTLNFPLNDDRANAVTVALGAGGTLSVTYATSNSGAAAHAIFDVTGYFVAGTSGAKYLPFNPTRILDTRYATGLSGAFTSHVARSFQVTGGVVPANAIAVTGNLTVTLQTSYGYLYIGPVATNNPTSSTLNFPLNDDRANAVAVALGAGGKLSITYVGLYGGAAAHAILDVTGYFVP